MHRVSVVSWSLVAACVCAAAPALAQDAPRFPVSAVPARGAGVQAFVPAGWKAASEVAGDLNGDGRPDRVVHVVPRDTHYEAGAVTAAPEAQALLILLAESGGGLRRAGVATRLLQTVAPQWGLRLTIRRGVLVVNQNYGMTEVADVTHRFRLEPATGRFLLIGRDQFNYHRPQELSDPVKVSENYLTGERLTTTGHYGAGGGYRETEKRERIPRTRAWLDDIDEDEEGCSPSRRTCLIPLPEHRMRPWTARARRVALLALALGVPLRAAAAQTSPARHPLDPLTREEIGTTVDVLTRAGRMTPQRRFGLIDLHEPPKRQVRDDLAAGRAPRAASALLYDWATRIASEAVVDLDRRAIISWHDLPPGEPPLRHIAISRLNEVVKADPRFRETLRRRGFADDARVTLLAGLDEGQPLPERGGDRFVGAFAFLNDGAPPALAIPGLEIEVNLTRGTVSRYEDQGPAAGPAADAADPYGGGRTGLRRLDMVQPDGPGFELRGSEVRWQKWRFHFGVHPRRGLELFDVAYEDEGRVRPVLYRARCPR